MNIRTLIGITAALIAVCALIAAVMFPTARIASVPVAVIGMLLAGSLFSAAGRLSASWADLKGQSVLVRLWEMPPAGAAPAVFRVQYVRAIGAGLHLWLEPPSGGKLTHLKVAQPKAMSRTAAGQRIADVAYVQWAGRKVSRQEGAAAVLLLTTAEPTALPGVDLEAQH